MADGPLVCLVFLNKAIKHAGIQQNIYVKILQRQLLLWALCKWWSIPKWIDNIFLSWNADPWDSINMGREFGKLGMRVRGIITYTMSPYEQKPFAGIFSKSVPNIIRRFNSKVFIIVPRELLLTFLVQPLKKPQGFADHSVCIYTYLVTGLL